jgi:hypothetical protein
MTNRKFWFTVAAQLIWVALLVSDHLSEPGFISLTNLTLGGYLIANVAQKKLTSQDNDKG